MSTLTTTQITTRLRTYALIAGLTALTITVGAVIGGAALPFFVALAVAFNAAGYFLSDRIALRLARAQPISAHEAPALHRITAELASRAGIPMPRLYVMPGAQPNAFATGRDPRHAAVALTEGLLMTMPDEHVEAIVAHELGHIRNRDILVSSLAATLAGAIGAAVNVLQLSFLFGGDEEESPLGLLGALAAMILAPIAGTLLQLAVSRQREYLADATAAELLGSGAPLADALAAIELEPARGLDVQPAMAPMYSVNPLPSGNLAQLFSTHPPIADRIRRLRGLTRTAPRRRAVVSSA